MAYKSFGYVESKKINLEVILNAVFLFAKFFVPKFWIFSGIDFYIAQPL